MTVKKDYTEINHKFDQRLEYMIDNHNKVTFFRMDVRLPKDKHRNKPNEDISDLMKRLKEPFTRAGNEMHYVWCREKETSENPHYHVAALVDGSQTQQVQGILHDANRIWQNITGSSKEGLIDYCNRHEGKRVPPQIRLDRPSSKKNGEELARQRQEFESKKAAVLERGHYLGKDDQKGDVPRRVREYGASELPKSCIR
jgi:hypothetical protein